MDAVWQRAGRVGEAVVMDHAAVQRWVEGYERLWRTPGTELLAELFTDDVRYLASPWAVPVDGRPALESFWETERDGPDEPFSMTAEVVAVDGRAAVVRVGVDYGSDNRWRDLWVLQFDGDGRCASFEEWPFAPDQRDGHG